MSFGATKLLSASGGKAYEIDQSVMFDSGDSSVLSRTPSSAGNLRTWTLSFWTKRTTLGSFQIMYSGANGGSGATDYGIIYFDSSDRLGFYYDNSTIALTNRRFRDVGAWYHIYIFLDTTASSTGDRWGIYINGVNESSWSEYNHPSQNTDIAFNNNIPMNIGGVATSSSYSYNGYFAEFHNIDGTVKPVTDFGKTDSLTGAWIPKKYTGGSFGTTGFYLPFAKNDRYSPYFNGNSSSGILTADHADFDVGSGNFTMECWFYVNEYAGNYRRVFGKSSPGGANADTQYQVDIDSSNQPVSYVYDAADNGTTYLTLQSSTAITDNKWHHVALVRNGTAFNLYLDGTSVANATSSMTVNSASYKFGIGRVGEYAGQIFNGWISNFRYVKGTAVYTSNFTPPTSPLTAITNTKLLCCQDANITTENSGTSKTLTVTAAQVTTHQMSPFTYDWYQDQSGQDNHWQADNLTVNDVLLDTPTNNFCTLNPLRNDITLTQGNLQAGGTYTSTTNKVYSTFGLISGKWWVQVHQSAANVYEANGVVNVSQSAENFAVNSSTNNVSVMNWGTTVLTNGSQTQTSLTAIGGSNVLGIALDLDNGTVQFYINGSTIGSATSLTRNTGDVFVFCQAAQTSGYSGNILEQWNFGQNGTHCGQKTAGGNTDGNGIGNFLNAPPSGFLAPCSSNLATQTVKKSTEHFNTKLYTGNGATAQEISLDFNPDLVWIKSRTDTEHYSLVDRVRGDVALNSNQNIAEYAVVNFDFNTNNTVDVPVYANDYSMNTNSDNYVMWHWKAGGATTTDVTESGSGTSRINASSRSVNTTAGFSIIKYTGSNDEISNGQHTKLNHGLSKAPDVVIIKNRDDTDSWIVASEATTFNDTVLFLNTASQTYGSFYTGTTDPDSTYIYLGNADQINDDGENFICYAWHEVEGFSKFGTYDGNGNANGPMIYTGFRPAWIMIKRTDVDEYWWGVGDNKRNPINPVNEALYPNDTYAEDTIIICDFISNGFKIQGTGNFINNSSGSYFYMAFAEFPFKYANAR